MTKTVYRSRIDWWAWLCFIGPLLPIWYAAVGMPWWFAVFISGGLTALFIIPPFGCRYVIEGNEIVVYQFFRPTRLPIAKIKSVKKTSGYLATAAMSHLRVSISFIDRSVLKSYAPLEISPKDRDRFINQLIEINPDIQYQP